MEDYNWDIMTRKELIKAAKKKAEELDMKMPFGNRKNEEYKLMAQTGEGLITNKAKREGKKRIPLGTFRQKLVVPAHIKEKGYKYRVVNGSPQRINDALAGGYDFVYDKASDTDEHEGSRNSLGKKWSYNVGTHKDGSPRVDFLMKIKTEFYEEDQAAKKVLVDEVDDAIHKGRINRGKDDKRYVPDDGGITIDTNFG